MIITLTLQTRKSRFIKGDFPGVTKLWSKRVRIWISFLDLNAREFYQFRQFNTYSSWLFMLVTNWALEDYFSLLIKNLLWHIGLKVCHAWNFITLKSSDAWVSLQETWFSWYCVQTGHWNSERPPRWFYNVPSFENQYINMLMEGSVIAFL